jgi:hypothetical protein
MDHPPSRGQKLPAFFHRRTFEPSVVSYQLSAEEKFPGWQISGCALRTISLARNTGKDRSPLTFQKISLLLPKSPHTGRF